MPRSHFRFLITSCSLSGLCSLTSKVPFRPCSLCLLPPWCRPHDIPSSHLCIQFHDMSHFVPAKAHKPPVVLRAVPSHDNVRLEIGLPLNTVRRGGRPPLGEVCGSMAFCPDVVPRSHGEKPLGKRKEAELPQHCWFGERKGICGYSPCCGLHCVPPKDRLKS